MKVYFFEKKEEVSLGFDANWGGTLISSIYYIPSLCLVFGKRFIQEINRSDFFVEENNRKEAEDVIDGKCVPNDYTSYSKVREFECDQEKIMKMIDGIRQYNGLSSSIPSGLENLLKG